MHFVGILEVINVSRGFAYWPHSYKVEHKHPFPKFCWLKCRLRHIRIAINTNRTNFLNKISQNILKKYWHRWVKESLLLSNFSHSKTVVLLIIWSGCVLLCINVCTSIHLQTIQRQTRCPKVVPKGGAQRWCTPNHTTSQPQTWKRSLIFPCVPQAELKLRE